MEKMNQLTNKHFSNELTFPGIMSSSKFSEVVLNELVTMRNNKVLCDFKEYETSYTEVTRYLLGSWLLTEDILGPPFDMKGIIIITTQNEIVDVAYYKGINIVLSSSLEDAIDSLFFQIYREDMVVQKELSHTFIFNMNHPFPKYFARLNKQDQRTKKKVEVLYKSLLRL
jgi:hypothetical protein